MSLTDEERQALERLANRRTSAQSMALRARIVLSSATGSPNAAVAGVLGVAPATVGKWRRRFVASRLDGLFDEPRPGAPRTISDDMVEAVIVKTLEQKPTDATHWSTRAMARAMGSDLDQPDLARLRAAAAPGRELQAVDRPTVRREDPRRRRSVPRSARAGRRAVRRREVR